MSLKKLNDIYSKINLGEFFKEDYCDYAIYRALQRIPHLVDGFAQTQRKIVYTMIDQKIEKKTKVSDLAAVVSLHTKYHHGSTSIETAISNLIPQFNNQLPLLREDGTFGNRSDRGAAAPRYVETRLFKYSQVIFNKIDNEHFVKTQIIEKKKIEPYHMIPVLPLLLINGQSQIGVGYATDILPRSATAVIKILKDVLSGKVKTIPTSIPPVAPMFKGTIKPAEKGGWIYRGVVKELTLTSVHITEVPPTYTRDSYITVLEKLKDTGKLRSYVENINGDEFDIKVKLSNDWANNLKDQTPSGREEALVKLLKLESKKSENITVINTKDKIVRYDNIAQVFLEYILYVLEIYKKRKVFILEKMTHESLQNKERIRFINLVNTDQIILKNKKRLVINVELEKQNFLKFDDSYDYLLNMRISNLTYEKVIELENIIDSTQLDYDKLKDKNVSQIWLDDITEIEKYIKKGE